MIHTFDRAPAEDDASVLGVKEETERKGLCVAQCWQLKSIPEQSVIYPKDLIFKCLPENTTVNLRLINILFKIN